MICRQFAVLMLFAGSAHCLAQPLSEPMRDDVSMDVYLSLLSQVAPAARDGAESYIAAFRARCGRELKAIELRRSFANGNGDPALMAMIRASHERDSVAVQRASAGIVCTSK